MQERERESTATFFEPFKALHLKHCFHKVIICKFTKLGEPREILKVKNMPPSPPDWTWCHTSLWCKKLVVCSRAMICSGETSSDSSTKCTGWGIRYWNKQRGPFYQRKKRKKKESIEITFSPSKCRTRQSILSIKWNLWCISTFCRYFVSFTHNLSNSVRSWLCNMN